CNISKGSFYTYFSSKDEMLLTILDEYKNLLKRIMEECTEKSKNMDEFVENYIKYRLNLNDEELEFELVLANLLKNFENVGNKNLYKLYKICDIHIDTIELNLKRYTSIPEDQIKTVARIIEGIRIEFHFRDTIEINEDFFRIKNLDEIKTLLYSDEMEKNRELVIKSIKKILKK
ncbi:MAG: TetR/AcrR family transcriptional regulator, partial [Fusobacterium gastrosuis]|uniref:TetR/AcrR family transcriptional regulator n=1 Tax=Fusobacterium gastrosuis TaxID=1755100 RepID=UPI002A8A461E|nr:TetR/AcrR family transcriptional regulator [Fusobacterium gastrosuis]